VCTSHLAIACVLALPSGDGLQPPRQELHEAHKLLHQPKSCSKTRFYRKARFVLFLGLVILNLLTKFHQNAQTVQEFLYFFFSSKNLNCQFPFAKMVTINKVLV
jgi:hypothetical protein